MRFITVMLATALVLIQYPLWMGKGSWSRVVSLQNQLEAVEAQNEELRKTNAKMLSEVESLQEGNDAIEERARYELAMVKKDEVFVQLLRNDQKSSDPTEIQPGVLVALNKK